ncbi:hypothetical protein VTL71DRAFT_2671 [Oculimacula yallundae]|uniref:Uncharacterized protein n=1 Tax=Oculimacula yallundae TaxID=86028 RepID=A0ABR4C9I1_9HELO
MPPKKEASTASAASSSSSTALQPTSSNANGKRTLSPQSATPKRISTGSTAEPTTAASSSSASAKSEVGVEVLEEQPDWAFDVAGKWTIDASKLSNDLPFFNHFNPGGPPPFTLELKYANDPRSKKIGRQLWGTFRWGTWTGCLRLAPGHDCINTHVQFYKECVLKKGVWPGPESKGEGSDEWQTQLQFSQAADGSLTLDGKMVAGGSKARKFSGNKTGDNPIPEGNEKSVETWWNKDLKDRYQESRLELSRPCKGDMDDSDESETDQEEVDAFMKKLDDARAKRMAQEAKDEADAEKPWPTPMSGHWIINIRDGWAKGEDQKATEQFMDIYEDDRDGKRQFWAVFQFGQHWNGVMRFCPVGYFPESKHEITVDEFAEGCILGDGVKAGPSPDGVNKWMIKWRGSLTRMDMPEEYRHVGIVDEMTTSCSFKVDDDGNLSFSGVIVEGGPVRSFKGTRAADAKIRGLEEPSIEKLWEDKKYIDPSILSPPKLYPWTSPLPAECIEKPPAWAWDVLGKWEIDAPDVIHGLEADKNAPFTMTIYLANSKRPAALGRQLWATFNVGTEVSGCMRFFPLPENSRPLDTVPLFEKACKLKKGIWPGDVKSCKGESFQKWGMRWRAEKASGEEIWKPDQYENAFNFKRDEDGNLIISGVWTVSYQPRLWKARKVEDGDVLDGTEGTVNAVWKRLANR